MNRFVFGVFVGALVMLLICAVVVVPSYERERAAILAEHDQIAKRLGDLESELGVTQFDLRAAELELTAHRLHFIGAAPQPCTSQDPHR